MKSGHGRQLTVLAMLLGVLIAVSSSQSDPGPRRFTHRGHVSTHWYGDEAGRGRDAEYARDCRGCHDSAADTRPDPQQLCIKCHFDQHLSGEASAQHAAWTLRSVPAPQIPSSARDGQYRHADHQTLACRECHAPVNEDEDIHTPSASNTGLCMRCHDKTPPAQLERVVSVSVAAGEFDFGTLRKRLMDRLNSDPALTREGRGPFLHSDHMTTADLGASAKCGACHASVPSAGARDLDEKAFDADACVACHMADGNQPFVISRSGLVIDETASTFEHRDHFRSAPSADRAKNCSAEAARMIASDGCLACHVHEEGVREPTYAIRADRADYAGCIACHDVERFKTKDHGNWNACVDCHAFGQRDMKSNRVTAQVLRAQPGAVTFLMPPVAHPGLAGKPIQQCADCHKAALPPAASRLGARFDHAQHVPKDASAESCAACHAQRIDRADSSTSIGLAASVRAGRVIGVADLLTFDPAACQACHPGIAVDPELITRVQSRDVPEFSHAHHLEKATDPSRPGAPVQCATCHPFEAGKSATKPPQLVSTLEAAQNCTLCHQHDAAHAEWTGKLHGSDVQSCAVCHEDRMPPREFRARAESPSLVTLSGPQHHPDDRGCEQCHLDTLSALPPSTAVIEASGALFTIHAGNKYPADCRGCHWALDVRTLGAQASTRETRRREGASLVGFPGGGESAEMRARFLHEPVLGVQR